MRLGWKVFLPWTLAWIAVLGIFTYTPFLSDIIGYYQPWRP